MKKCIFFGGLKSMKESLNNLFEYNFKEESWKKIEPKGEIPSERDSHSITIYEKDISFIIFGGS